MVEASSRVRLCELDAWPNVGIQPQLQRESSISVLALLLQISGWPEEKYAQRQLVRGFNHLLLEGNPFWCLIQVLFFGGFFPRWDRQLLICGFHF